MTTPDAITLVMLAALTIYVLTAGADFGGGVWDLFARGPRAAAQRAAIEEAIAPVWEANHVWLILVVVLLFYAFPPAFAAIATALHVPLTAALLGIVARGSSFVFRHYGGGGSPRAWGRVFAIASVLTPLFLGVCLAAISSGGLEADARFVPRAGFFAPWLGAFPLSVAALALAAFAYLAAVYLCVETAARDAALASDFRARALAAWVAVAVTAVAAAVAARSGAPAFAASLLDQPWSALAGAAALLVALLGAAALVTRRYRAARGLAALEVILVVVGWGLAQRPYLVRPSITVASAAAPASAIAPLLPTLAAGSVLLVPSLYVLMRVFKTRGA